MIKEKFMIKNLDYNYLEVKVLKTDYRELLPIFDYFEKIIISNIKTII